MSPFEWHDGLRCASIAVSLASIFLLFRAWRTESKDYDVSEKDIWFILLVWAVTTIIICFDGIRDNLDFGPRSVCVILASTLTLLVLIRRTRRRRASVV